ncbi:methyltransferase family protein [Nitrosomonas aestuarii]|uniref:methyltransferase family protein n=1 Tax=Nitrosomonas aestuarii TaxID=52441 RepID=UPI000D4314BC|nr:isoprenylcysteine carboxylmethyltransferase family protein [Nitrosomonas aestuarii]PTN11081.1 protein-S-isoprenylcysteine O-methyltransferase Ste14 [Nitrosomonas aestuarii]
MMPAACWLDYKIPPPVVGMLVATAMWALAEVGPQFALAPQVRYSLVGILIIAGGVFDLLGLVAFRASRTTINPLKPELASALVTGGVYRFTRNPMYVGVVLFLLAWGVYLSALLPLAGLPFFIMYITRFQIQPEERVLMDIFGEQYSSYAKNVRRWL